MKLLVTASLLLLSIAALHAQNAPVYSSALPLGGYFVVYPQAPLITIRFDGNSEDIAKVTPASRAGTSFNHDGAAFNTFVRSTSAEYYHDNLVDYVQRDRNVTEYKRNVKSGKWTRFKNGE